MYKLVALDIDGTLLNSSGQVDPSTLDIIKQVQKKGVMVTISTGRPIQGVYKYIEMLNLKSPIITYNGGMIIDSETGRTLFDKKLKDADTKQVIELGLEKDTSMIAWSNNKLYANRIDDYTKQYQKMSGQDLLDLKDYENLCKTGVTKVIWINEPETLKGYQETLKMILNESITAVTSKAHYLEFFNKEVSKARALEYIGQKYHIKREEMIAIGDGNNDIDMIDYVGLGIAMENATDAVKKVSNYVTKSNDEQGIFYALNKFIINKY